MSLFPTRFPTKINEQSTAVYAAVLKDELGNVIGSGIIDALTVTLANAADGAILNGREDQDALNANDVTVDANGNLEFTLQPADTAIQDTAVEYETHRATFKLQFNTVSFANWDVEFLIRNLAQVT